MNIEELRDYCLQKPGVTEGFPFGEETLVFKIAEKIFLLIGLTDGNRFNVKCDPELAIELRERHSEVIPGYHMNKKMWNTVYMDGALTNKASRYDRPLLPSGGKKPAQKDPGRNRLVAIALSIKL